MKITTPYNTPYKTNNRPNFGWLKICQGNVIKRCKNRTEKLVPVDICLLKEEEEDKDFMSSIYENWRKNTTYGADIIENFLDSKKLTKNSIFAYNYFMLIPTKQNSLLTKLFHKTSAPKPMCLAQLSREDDDIFKLDMIQTASDILVSTYNKNLTDTNGKKRYDSISGSGQVLLHGICRFINSWHNPILKIGSFNHGFYEKIFNTQADIEDYFHINNETLINFLKETCKKYSISEEKISLPQKIITQIIKNSFD